MSENYTSTCTGGTLSPAGNYRVDRISTLGQMSLEDFCNGYLKEKKYKPVSISEVFLGSEKSIVKDTRYTILSKKMNFFERIFEK